MDNQNWTDWGFKALAIVCIIVVIVTLRAIWSGFWGIVERLLNWVSPGGTK